VRPLSAHAYAAAATLAAPALGAMLRLRAARGKEIGARLPERRGLDRTPRPGGALIWLHAASVGETLSVLPVLAQLAERAPEVTTLLTTGTVTSARLLTARLPELGLDGRVLHRFVPLDVPAWAARFLDHWRPDAAAFVESELWPNLLAACARRAIPAMLVNARLSPRSQARWRRAPGLARALLQQFARIEARSDEDAGRLRALGAGAVAVPGDLKFAAPPLPADPAEMARLGERLNGRPVWLAGSTHPGEDEAVFAAHHVLAPRHPGLLTIVVPRHPERGPRIAALAKGWPVARRAAGGAPPEAAGVYVADTLGELGLWYRLAPIAFIGGSLVPHGGQNPLEAGRLGCAIAAGPHMGNFSAAVAALEQADAIGRVAGAASLGDWVGAMLADPARRRQMGVAARQAADRWADLPARCADSLLTLLRQRRPA
jgi:3-deoxy-D-manno-octulosonic-acid transferase